MYCLRDGILCILRNAITVQTREIYNPNYPLLLLIIFYQTLLYAKISKVGPIGSHRQHLRSSASKKDHFHTIKLVLSSSVELTDWSYNSCSKCGRCATISDRAVCLPRCTWTWTTSMPWTCAIPSTAVSEEWRPPAPSRVRAYRVRWEEERWEQSSCCTWLINKVESTQRFIMNRDYLFFVRNFFENCISHCKVLMKIVILILILPALK